MNQAPSPSDVKLKNTGCSAPVWCMKVLLNCRMTFTVDPAALLEAWLPTGTVSMWHSTPKLLKDFLVALINDSCEGSLSDLNVTELWPRSRTNHTNSVHRYFNGLPAFCSVENCMYHFRKLNHVWTSKSTCFVHPQASWDVHGRRTRCSIQPLHVLQDESWRARFATQYSHQGFYGWCVRAWALRSSSLGCSGTRSVFAPLSVSLFRAVDAACSATNFWVERKFWSLARHVALLPLCAKPQDAHAVLMTFNVTSYSFKGHHRQSPHETSRALAYQLLLAQPRQGLQALRALLQQLAKELQVHVVLRMMLILPDHLQSHHPPRIHGTWAPTFHCAPRSALCQSPNHW